MQNFISVIQARDFYSSLGIDTLPLRPNTKKPFVSGWPERDPAEMWKDAPQDSNIGIRCGGNANLAVIDCDEKNKPGTFENIRSYLQGLGIQDDQYPVVSTASGNGRHIYLASKNDIGGNYSILKSDFGAGEVRYGPGAMVVAPPSSVNGTLYEILRGDFRNIARVDFSDLIPLMNSSTTVSMPHQSTLHFSDLAGNLLHGMRLEKYRSRSEAEEALIVSLINSGYSYAVVLSLFLQYPCAGKFKELYNKNPQDAIRWFDRSYSRAMGYSQNHTSRNRAAAIHQMDWAFSNPWTGRGASSDRDVFIALADISARSGKEEIGASVREVAELAGISFMTASRSIKRLINRGHIQQVAPACIGKPSIFRIVKNHTAPAGQPTLQYGDPRIQLSRLDAFRNRGLGKSALQIWTLLRENGHLNAKEISKRTGRHIATVRKHLNFMSRIKDGMTGEFIPLVEKLPNRLWKALSSDFDLVARVVGTAGKAERQKKEHQEQRRCYRNALKRNGVDPTTSISASNAQ